MFLSRIFINKVLPITKAVPHYDDYPLKFYKAQSKLYRISLAPKRNNIFIRIIAAIDSWYCNSLLLLSRLTRVTKKISKNVALNLKLNQLPRLSKSEFAWLVTRVAWATGLLNSGKQFHALIESTTKISIRLRVLSCSLKITSPRVSWLPATEFWLICSVNKSFILMWVYRLWQNEWLFW